MNTKNDADERLARWQRLCREQGFSLNVQVGDGMDIPPGDPFVVASHDRGATALPRHLRGVYRQGRDARAKGLRHPLKPFGIEAVSDAWYLGWDDADNDCNDEVKDDH